jgi:hypothetical protein
MRGSRSGCRAGAARRWLALGLLAAGAATAIVSSCAVAGFDLVDGVPLGGAGGVGGTQTGGGDGGEGACQNAEPPLAPDGTDPGSDVDFVVAVRSIDFGEDFDEDVGPAIGYDLDAKCTCLGDMPSCATVGSAPEDCDGPNGRDNAVARLFDNLSLFEPNAFDSQHHSADADMGNWTLLIRVMGYSGGANDEEVTVAVYPSPGLDQTPCAPDMTPAWNGADVWPVEALAIEGGTGGGSAGTGGAGGAGGSGGCDPSGEPLDVDQPRFVSQVAYVSDHVLVANLPEAGITLAADGTPVTLRLVGGFLTARLEMTATGWFMHEGVLTGRWALADFFGVVGKFTANGEPICTDSQLYGPVKEIVCNYADIHSGVSGSAAPCDAMSFGMGFEAEPALLGVIVDTGGGEGNVCPPGTDPAGDSCEE